MRRETPEMNVSRGVHNRSIFVLIPTPSHLRVTVVQRRQQKRKKRNPYLALYIEGWNCPDFSNQCARSREKHGSDRDYPL